MVVELSPPYQASGGQLVEEEDLELRQSSPENVGERAKTAVSPHGSTGEPAGTAVQESDNRLPLVSVVQLESTTEQTNGPEVPRALVLRAAAWYITRLGHGVLRGLSPSPYVLCFNQDLVPTLLLSFTAAMLLGVFGRFVVEEKISSALSSLMLPSFGASCAILYGLPKSPMAQPRNLFVGHFIGATFGLSLAQALRQSGTVAEPLAPLIAGSLASGLALTVMMWTNTMHPPGCATAFASASVRFSTVLGDNGFYFFLNPVLSGCIILFLVAWLGNNLFPWRSPYPTYW